MARNHMKNVQHHQLLIKWNSKLQWVSPHTGQNGPSSKNPQILNAGEDMKKREYFCTINGNVKFYNHCGEQNKDYLKKKKKKQLGIK